MQPRALLVAALLALLASARKQLWGWAGDRWGRFLPRGPLGGGLVIRVLMGGWAGAKGSPEAEPPHRPCCPHRSYGDRGGLPPGLHAWLRAASQQDSPGRADQCAAGQVRLTFILATSSLGPTCPRRGNSPAL